MEPAGHCWPADNGSALTLLTANAVDLTSVATLGSGGFLLLFAAVNTANARQARRTGNRAWISVIDAVTCMAALAALMWQTAHTVPAKPWVLAGMFGLAIGIEGACRLAGKGTQAQGDTCAVAPAEVPMSNDRPSALRRDSQPGHQQQTGVRSL